MFDAENLGSYNCWSGPAGLAAATEMAKAKTSVLVLDRKQEIGCPKRCAEGLGMVGLKD